MAESTDFVIVVGVDFSDPGNRAFERAIELGGRLGGFIHLCYVADDRVAAVTTAARVQHLDTVLRAARDQSRDYLDRQMKEISGRAGFVAPRGLVFHVRAGAPGPELIRLAAELDADLIVVGTHGAKGIERLVMGSVSERVVRLARCPVLVVRPKTHEQVERTTIEPPCPDCVEVRQKTNNEQMWCERHGERHAAAHRFSYYGDAPASDSLRFGA